MGVLLEKRRPPAHIRPELDLECHIKGASVEVVEIRPQWAQPDRKVERPIAKATYVKTKKHWRVFWVRSDLKWHRYDPPEVATLQAFAKLVAEDKHACFFG
jgi:hypothetical protein